jgi:hypothetical protein
MTTKSTTGTSPIIAATVPIASATTPAASPLDPIHDAAQQARNLRLVLQDDKQRIGLLSWCWLPSWNL